jgi:protein-S-isoprenylcysteine O-methyltransferase Ste14
MISAMLVAAQFALIALVVARAALHLAGLGAAVLLVKARREERGMALAHPGYAEYRARTRAIVPFLL